MNFSVSDFKLFPHKFSFYVFLCIMIWDRKKTNPKPGKINLMGLDGLADDVSKRKQYYAHFVQFLLSDIEGMSKMDDTLTDHFEFLSTVK